MKPTKNSAAFKIWLAASLILFFCPQPHGFSAEGEREVKVRPVSEIETSVRQDSQTSDLEMVSKEAGHYKKRKTFIGELRLDAEKFQEDLKKIKKPEEKAQKTQEFRETRVKKIKEFLDNESAHAADFDQKGEANALEEEVR